MTIRHRTSQIRASVHDLASDLHGIALDVQSAKARVALERARKLMVAAHHEIDAAMREALDPVMATEPYEDGAANSRDTSVVGWVQ